MRDLDWETIVTLHKTRNITKSAELLFVSQPSLTKRIQVIEKELGVRFLIRSRKGTEFTQVGEVIARKAEQIINATEEVHRDIADLTSGRLGTLRLGVPNSYTRFVLPILLKRFSAMYPRVEISILTQSSEELVQLVEEDALHLCFARYPTTSSVLEKLLISEDQVFVVYNRPFALEELPTLPMVEFEKNSATAEIIQRWWKERFSVQPNVRFSVNTGDSCLSMIRQGLGFGFFPDQKYFEAVPGIYAKPLVFQDGSSFTRKTWLVFRKSISENAVAQNFLNFVRDTDFETLWEETSP